MKRIFSLLIITAITTVTLYSCADSESRIPVAGNARVVIDLGLPHDQQPQEVSILDRALRLFAHEAIAAETAPASFSSITVRVTAPDIGVIEETFPSSGTVSMNVPAGTLRTFEVTALVSPYNSDVPLTWTAAESFRGVTRANLPSGATVSVPVLMKLETTKIIVPDYYQNRIVILNNMTGSPYYLTAADYSGDWVSITQPRDVDFDARGRIYFVYQYGLSRCDDTGGSGGISLYYSTTLVAAAVDRTRDLVYFTDGTTVFRRNLDGTLPGSLPDTVNTGGFLMGIRGLDVAPDGDVLVAAMDNYTYYNGFFKLDSAESNAGVKASFTDSQYIAGMVPDIMIQGIYVYVLNPYPPNEPYSMNLMQFVSGPGGSFTLVGDGPLPSNGSFANAGHFSSIRNDGLIIMDKIFGTPDSKIIFMRDVRGNGWVETSDPTLQFYDYAQGG
jgi:hypothetical protein